MKKHFFLLFCILSPLSLVFSGGQSDAVSDSGDSERFLTVYAAASTSDLIEEAGELFKKASGIDVHINAASSGTLAKQIEQGAPADLYISASKTWMDYIYDLGLVKEKSPFLTNKLVVIVPSDSDFSWAEGDMRRNSPPALEGFLSMGDPEHVPAGKYAQESLIYYGWFDALEAQILPAADVRAALGVVELGEADCGIVYQSDAERTDKVKIVSVFPAESHSPIEYYCSELKESSADAEEFYRFLLENEEVGDLFLSYGFSLPVAAE